MRIYVESTIPSYVVARPARDLLRAAHQQVTRDWWDLKRAKHELFTSQVVLNEIGSGDQEMARQRLELMATIKLLDLTEDAKALTKEILRSGALPSSADRDAAHIANAAIQARLRRLTEKSGFALPVLCTPNELTGELYE